VNNPNGQDLTAAPLSCASKQAIMAMIACLARHTTKGSGFPANQCRLIAHQQLECFPSQRRDAGKPNVPMAWCRSVLDPQITKPYHAFCRIITISRVAKPAEYPDMPVVRHLAEFDLRI